MKVLQITGAVMVAFFLIFTMSSCSKVPAGYVGVKVYLLGGAKGVDSETLSVGRYWIGWNEDLYLFPTFTQNYNWTEDDTEGSPNDESISFQGKSGLSFGADVGISYAVDGAMAQKVFQKYRRGIEEITDIYLRNMVRDAFNQVCSTMEDDYIYGIGKTKILEDVEELIRSQVDTIGINVEKIYLTGRLRLPEQVYKALNSKIEATQKAQQRENEVREAIAQARKDSANAVGAAYKITLEANAQAEAIRKVRQQLTSEYVAYLKATKWDGNLPQVTGSAIPMLDLRK